MRKTVLTYVVALCLGTSPAAFAEGPEHTAEPALARFELRVRSDEATLDEGTQRLRGHVRVDVVTRAGEVVLTLRAEEAERRGHELTLHREVRLEVPEGARGGGLESLLEAQGLELQEALLTADSVHVDLDARLLEVRDLDAEARAERDGRAPRARLRAERVVLSLSPEGAWRTRVFRPQVGMRFD
jgi:hypothetical protein